MASGQVVAVAVAKHGPNSLLNSGLSLSTSPANSTRRATAAAASKKQIILTSASNPSSSHQRQHFRSSSSSQSSITTTTSCQPVNPHHNSTRSQQRQARSTALLWPVSSSSSSSRNSITTAAKIPIIQDSAQRATRLTPVVSSSGFRHNQPQPQQLVNKQKATSTIKPTSYQTRQKVTQPTPASTNSRLRQGSLYARRQILTSGIIKATPSAVSITTTKTNTTISHSSSSTNKSLSSTKLGFSQPKSIPKSASKFSLTSSTSSLTLTSVVKRAKPSPQVASSTNAFTRFGETKFSTTRRLACDSIYRSTRSLNSTNLPSRLFGSRRIVASRSSSTGTASSSLSASSSSSSSSSPSSPPSSNFKTSSVSKKKEVQSNLSDISLPATTITTSEPPFINRSQPGNDQMVIGSPLVTPPPSESDTDIENDDNQSSLNNVSENVVSTTPLKVADLNQQLKSLDIPIKSEPICDYYDLESRPFARGKFAQVKRCVNKTSNHCFAAKCIKKRRRLVDIRHEILLEIEALKLSYHTNRIVKLYEVFETPTEMILVLEMANGGELQRVLDDEEIIEEGLVRKMVQQILEGLEKLHDNDIAHLDIKPQNLLLTESFPKGDIKLCDFGISRRITKDCEIREICGTPDYVAPEILSYDPITLATDMWSLGVITYVLLSGYSPFGSENKQQTFCNITQATLDFPTEIFDKISKEAIDFMQKLIVKEPSERLTSRQARNHPWLAKIM